MIEEWNLEFMKTYLKCVLTALLFPIQASLGQSEVTLENVLEELQALRAQVSALEARIESLESSGIAAAITASESKIDSEERRNWFEKMRLELKKADAKAIGGWTKPENWTRISVGQKLEEVVEILGKPTKRKFSVKKKTDEILIYEGDLSGNGALIEGTIRIYKGKVNDIEAPRFP